MFVSMEMSKDKDEIGNCIGIVLGLVERSDEVVGGTNERVSKARIFRRLTEERRGDAKDAKSVRGVARQQKSVETVKGELVSMACVVGVRLTGTVMEPREYKVRWFYSVDSPWIARDAVWQRRGTRCRELMAKSAESASDRR